MANHKFDESDHLEDAELLALWNTLDEQPPDDPGAGVSEAVQDILARLLAMPARTFLGIVIKARTITVTLPGLWDRPSDQLSPENLILRNLVDDIFEVAGVTGRVIDDRH
jgi:hypothetical protein